MLSLDELTTLRETGYAFCYGLDRTVSTLEFASKIGTVLNLHVLDQAYPDRSLDILRPKEQSAESRNRYHGNFGFGDYPAHTDLAHWLIPPRYLLLRGRAGSASVKTYIHGVRRVEALLPYSLVKRALFLPRSARVVTALPFAIPRSEGFTLRWDPIFIQPANSYAIACADILLSDAFVATRDAVVLDDDGMALIIDNWRSLHGRSSVPLRDRTRIVERIYLEDIHGISS